MHESDTTYRLTWGDWAAFIGSIIVAAEFAYLAAVLA